MIKHYNRFQNLIFKPKKRNIKKFIIYVCVFALLVIICFLQDIVFAENSQEIIDKLNFNVFEQLNNINLVDVEIALKDMIDEFNFLQGRSFKESVEGIINGNYFTDFNNIFSAIFSLVFGDVSKYLPLMFTIIAVSLLGQFVASLKSKTDDNVSDLIHFVTYSVIVILIVVVFKNIISVTSSTINSIKSLTDAIFPVMLTLMTAVGGVVSVGIYRPTLAILSGGVITLFNGFVQPLFIFSFVIVVVGNLTESVKLKKLNECIFSMFKWTMGFIFTLFGAILTFQGISAGRHDGVSVSATRFAIKTYVPIIGGYLSEGLDFILLSSVLIKNAVGLAGLILIFITILSPIIQLIVFKLILQIPAAILETVGSSQTSNFLQQCSKVMLIPIIMVLGVAFMCILTLSLLMCTANII